MSNASSLNFVSVDDAMPGMSVWAKQGRYTWWPGLIVSSDQCMTILKTDSKCCVYWYGHNTISPVTKHLKMVSFIEYFSQFNSPKCSNQLKTGVLLATKDLMPCHTQCPSQQEIIVWAENGFKSARNIASACNNSISDEVKDQLQILGLRNRLIPSEEVLKTPVAGHNQLCFACKGDLSCIHANAHPIFEAELCDPCLEKFKQNYFSINMDWISCFSSLHAFRKTMCLFCLETNCPSLIHCSRRFCFKSVCDTCYTKLARKKTEAWFCCLCIEPHNAKPIAGITAHADWKRRVMSIFHSKTDVSEQQLQGAAATILFCCSKESDDLGAVLARHLILGMKFKTINIHLSGGGRPDKITRNLQVDIMQVQTELPLLDLVGKQEVILRPHIFVVICEGTGEGIGSTFFSFFSLLSRMKDKSSDSVFWLFLLADPQKDECYPKLISRYLECEPGQWSQLQDRLVWTNISL